MAKRNKVRKRMARQLFITGPTGCGKSTVLRQSLGMLARHAGGFVTVRSGSVEAPEGFDLAPAAWLADQELPRWRFLSFVPEPVRDDICFVRHGVPLLEQAEEGFFAVLDEIGGLELLQPEFYTALEHFLDSGMPCIGVLKSRETAQALMEKTALPELYLKKLLELYAKLECAEDVIILKMETRGTPEIRQTADWWVRTYAQPFAEKLEG